MSGQLDQARSIALQAMIDGTEKMLTEGSPVRRMAIGWRGGDQTCDVVGDQIMGEIGAVDGAPENLDLFIMTQAYTGGGHTAVVGDFVRASESTRAEVILTGTVERDIHKGDVPSQVIERLGIGAEELSVCPEVDRANATRWVMEQIRDRRPRRVFLFHHPQDAVAIAAARPELCGELYLVHHADRQPTLGLHQRGTRIIDLSPFTGEFTRRVLGLAAGYAPIIVGDPGTPPEREIRPPFTTVCSGAAHKFGKDYGENIVRILETTGGKHIHIGFLKVKRLEKLRKVLDQNGIGQSRLEYIEWVPSLAQAFIDLGADISISSAPMGGARTAIEALAAGVPILAHVPDFSTLFGVNHVAPKSLPVWRNIDELVALLQGADPAWIRQQGKTARTYYEQNHHPAMMQNALRNLGDPVNFGVEDLPLSELVEVEKLREMLADKNWSFLRSEFLQGAIESQIVL